MVALISAWGHVYDVEWTEEERKTRFQGICTKELELAQSRPNKKGKEVIWFGSTVATRKKKNKERKGKKVFYLFSIYFVPSIF